MKKKILQVNLDGTGGAFSLIYQLQLQLKDEFVFDYYWMGNFIQTSKSDKLKKIGSKIYEDNLRRHKIIGHILLPWHFYTFLKKHKYDVIHINADLAYKELLYALPAKKAGVKKIIIHSHSSGVNGKYRILKYILHKLCRPFLNKYGDVFLTCSKVASKWMYNDENKGIMINNGVNLNEYKFNSNIRKEFRRKLNISDTLIGTVGNLSYQKNPEFLIQLLEKLNRKNKKYTLIFIGDGDNRNKVEEYATKLGVYNDCIFYGNTNKVKDILNALDIFVMPSRFEGLPVSAVEAQANGLVCIFSNNITKEVKLLPTTIMLSINEGITPWIEIIQRLMSKINIIKNRNEASKILKKEGFDIEDSAKLLKKIYNNKLEIGK